VEQKAAGRRSRKTDGEGRKARSCRWETEPETTTSRHQRFSSSSNRCRGPQLPSGREKGFKKRMGGRGLDIPLSVLRVPHRTSRYLMRQEGVGADRVGELTAGGGIEKKSWSWWTSSSGVLLVELDELYWSWTRISEDHKPVSRSSQFS